jgi:D-alanyl-lipoteichoic acid acyltransferase DltB (MBOAT superfamily)
MLFHSLQFLVFFAITTALYYACPPRYRWAFLLAASYYFYAAWAPVYVVWLAVTTLIAYVLALEIAKTPAPGRRKAFLALGVFSNLGLLISLKYLDFINESLRALFERFSLLYNVPAFQVLLPVGISFYVLQTLGYLIDVYRGEVKPERHLGFLALFVSFFPQLVTGPIERAGHLIPQLRTKRGVNAAGISDGLRMMLWGTFKKVVVADRLAMYVDAVYNHPAEHRGLPVLLATAFYAVQIYCDFSGYTDIALGTAKVLGYDLTENFRQPYCSPSIAEFWRRWHISLSLWFRDYLYIPLGGNRVARWRWYANLMTVFVLSGLWHGANWTFVLWGGLHGLYYLVQIGTQTARDRAFQALRLDRPAVRTTIGTLVTLVLVCLAWLFFRANSVSDAFLLLGNLVRIGASTDIYAPWTDIVSSPGLEMALALGLVALLTAVHLLREYGRQTLTSAGRVAWVRWVVYVLLALAILNLGMAKQVPFVYLQF